MQYLPSDLSRIDVSGPLNRFLPPVPDGTARAYTAELGPATAWILDPFAALPRLAVEMARTGQRVLVAAGNPVSRFLLDLAAQPPKLTDLQAALADLAAARKEGKRLETHLQSLYTTRCDQCQRELPAEAFLWEAKTGVLVGRIYNCVCGSGGEHPATPDDVENAARWARSDGLHRSRALERVAPGDDPDRPFAEEALSFYLPRAVYAIGTIVNRLDNSPRIDHSSPGIYPRGTSDERRRCMSALLLYAADCANALWPHLTERPRPRQLTFSPVYRENNVWMALEAGVKVWASTESPIPLTLWPDEPDESGGLCVFEGPLRDLVSDLMGKPRFDAKQPSTSRGQGVSIKAVVTAIPRPNQAFWTLSALWSGWLWGRTAVGPFKSVLRRRRYDWQWHAEALKALFGNLVEILPPDVPFLGILAEPEASFISAVYLAAQAAGLETISQQDRYGRSITESGESRLRRDGGSRNELEPVQILWKKVPAVTSVNGGLSRGVKKKPLSLDVNYTCKVIRETLEKNNEPMAYLHIHTAVLTALAKKGMLQWSDDALSMLGKNIHAALASPEFVDLEDRSIPEKGKWALKKWGEQGLLQGM